MAHEIEILADGTASFVAAFTPGWHGLGTVVDHAMTSGEALELSHANFDVILIPDGGWHDGKFIPDPEKRKVIREDPNNPGKYICLGTVGTDYRVYQYRQLFKWLDDLVDDASAKFHTAGVLRDGRQVFVSIKLPEGVVISVDGVDDINELYIVGFASHDMSMSIGGAATFTRVVCKNTLTIGLANAVSSWKVKHTERMEGRIAEAREALRITFQYAEEWKNFMQSLAETSMTKNQFSEVCNKLWPVDTDSAVTNDHNDLYKAEATYILNNETSVYGNDTAWGGLNALTFWLDHKRPVKASKDTVDMSDEMKRAYGSAWNPTVAKTRDNMVKTLVAVTKPDLVAV